VLQTLETRNANFDVCTIAAESPLGRRNLAHIEVLSEPIAVCNIYLHSVYLQEIYIYIYYMHVYFFQINVFFDIIETSCNTRAVLICAVADSKVLERLCYNIMLLCFVVTVRPVDIEVIGADKDRRPEPKCDFSRKCEERKDNKDIYPSMVE